MTKTLKIRFVIFSMTAVTCLLLFVFAAINGLNLIMLEQQSDMTLEMLVASEGSFYKMDFDRPPPFAAPLNLEQMRSARFFIVRTDIDGNIADINLAQISSIDQEQAKSYAIEAWTSGKDSGKIDHFKFAVKQKGTTAIICFIDTVEQTENFYRIFFSSGFIVIACWIVLFLIVVLLSGRVIRPVLIGMEKQKQFITNAGHEMKTPLAIIQSNNDTMALIHGENKYNVNIRLQTKRLNVLMSNLLTLAKLDEDIPLPKEPLNVSDLVAVLIPVYQEEADSNSVQLTVDIESNICIQTNRDSFCQLLTILMDNALKYTPAHGSILLTMRKCGKKLQITEENTCDAIHESDPERLFERFYRGDSARTQNKDSTGYGIGLSAARAICENFGGSLSAKYPTTNTIRFSAEF